MRIRDILDPQAVVLDLKSGAKRDILRALSAPIARLHASIDHDRLVDVLAAREETSTTAIADGIAIPHGKVERGDDVICGFGLSREGVDFDSIDGNPTHLFFLLVSPGDHPSLHLRWLAHLAVMLKNPELRKRLVAAQSAEDVLGALEREEDDLAKKEPAARRT
jgi:PTS system nitrogen regulatory IIA component